MNRFKRGLLVLFSSVAALFAVNAVYSDTTGSFPPVEADTQKVLNSSPRHGEWVTYTTGKGDKVDAWVVYPERKERAPVVLVIHEIFGLNDWARAVADQLAAAGYIAIAPDFLSGKAPGGKGSRGLSVDDARALNSKLDPTEVIDRLNGAMEYAKTFPSADNKFAVVGFCWGGGMSFLYAAKQPALSAAVVYYGTSPSAADLQNIRVPVLGLYGGSDNRVNATIPPAESELKRLNRPFEKEIYDGAGHAFLRQQDGMNGANMKAAQAAWPRTLDFISKAFASGAKTGLLPSENLYATAVDECCD